jgi:O-acetyl-ADP-ribose deacetylase (regulator of RNase III)
LRGVIQELSIRSIALPPLGCGEGGLDWQDVRSLIEEALGDLSEVEVAAYEPVPRPLR